MSCDAIKQDFYVKETILNSNENASYIVLNRRQVKWVLVNTDGDKYSATDPKTPKNTSCDPMHQQIESTDMGFHN